MNEDAPTWEPIRTKARHHLRESEKSWWKRCPFGGKHVFPTYAEAERMRTRLKKRDINHKPLFIYRCAKCHKYHLTSQEQKR